MSQATFDTLEYMELLKNSGFTEQQAKGLTKAQALAEANKVTEQSLEARGLATKEDIAELKLEMNKIESRQNEKTERFRAELIYLIIGLFIAQTAALAGVLAIIR